MAQRPTEPDPNRQMLRAAAAAVGLHTVRFAVVRPTPRHHRLDRWLARGRAATMHWLARGRDERADPRVRIPQARTAVVLAARHAHERPPDPGGRTGLVARYAWGRDYHNLMGKRVRRLQRALRREGIACWGGVDTAPISERAWATAAGLGFNGKNTMQIAPGETSWMFLGVVFVDLPTTPDPPIGSAARHCGSCRRCLDVCPTGAFHGPHDLDAGRCISFWTIEARDLAPRSLRPGFGRWVFGCDLCQEVCPHNHSPPPADFADLAPVHAWLDLDQLLSTPDAALLERFIGTPLRRPGAPGLKRNAAVALGNIGDDAAVPVLRSHGLTHDQPMVRAASVWALHRLGAPVPLRDPHPSVQVEIEAAQTAEGPDG